tara:strand:- start:2440 stop:2640 length:201 start_codon:yes stop_codon:yes gene_type:complete
MEERRMTFLLIGLVILVVVIAGVQTVQINALEEKIESGELKAGSATDGTIQVAARPAAAPTMVGGC